MQPAIQRCRRFVRRGRRRARGFVRSLLLHVVVLALVALGLLARMSESSDVQLAMAQRAAALARLDPPARPMQPGVSAGPCLPPGTALAGERSASSSLASVAACEPGTGQPGRGEPSWH